MRRSAFFVSVVALASLAPPLGAAVAVRVNNPYGDVVARVVDSIDVRISHSSPARPSRKDDVTVTQRDGLVEVECKPADGARLDVRVDLNYGSSLEATTSAGAIFIQGMIARAILKTDRGSIELAVPWEATRIAVKAVKPPGNLSLPPNARFEQRTSNDGWTLRDRLPESKVTYGSIEVAAGALSRIVLKDIPLPEDAPVKLPWQAPAILDELLRGTSVKKKPGLRAPRTSPRAGAPAESPGLPVFTSDVRMVNLAVAVTDAKGNPATGLGTGDFEVVEDGVPQKIAFTGSEEVPFNLAILLDLSGSTRRSRPAMKEAARRFIEIARPQDRVAAYALANELLYIISHLTPDRAQLRASIEAIPEVSGGTPLYDAIVLSYAEEFRRRPNERNALIVISDGIDNQIQGAATPSSSSFPKLHRAAAEMHALIYPVFLDPFDKVPPPPWFVTARQHVQQLADASGGRLFRARSAEDLEPVYPQVADELRSVYTVAYYPSNQNFDGTWRKVQVRIQRPGVRARTRAGYFAR